MADSKDFTGSLEAVESTSRRKLWIVIAVALSATGAYIETDIYVPSFPDMLVYFGTDETTLQFIVSSNFIGIFLGCLVYGSLADCYGRRKVMLTGMVLFVISSVGCVISSTIYQLIGWRFLQGIGSATPMCMVLTIVMDIYDKQKARKILTILTSITTAVMAFAPATGSWLNLAFGWQSNFILITIFAFVSFVMLLVFLDETLPISKRQEFHLWDLIKKYSIITIDPKFFFNMLIVSFMYGSFLLYLSNLSLIFITHLGVDEKIYVWYQSAAMGTFATFCLFANSIITACGVANTRRWSSVMALLGAVLLFLTAIFFPSSTILITITFCMVSIGCALSVNIYAVEALDAFPEMKGMTSSMAISMRQALTGVIIAISSLFFDGSIMPVAVTTMILATVSVFAYMRLSRARL